MPELPEVETIRRTLEQSILGQRIAGAELRTPGYVKKGKTPVDLLLGGRIVRVDRHGKQLALEADDGRVVCIHLGMSGQLLLVSEEQTESFPHSHVLWKLAGDGKAADQCLLLRDPRRFGGVWTYDSMNALRGERWGKLGVDALDLTTERLRVKLSRTRRAIKAALLDQRVVAGLGNIYCDESLFRAGVKPHVVANRLSKTRTEKLTRAIHTTLELALKARGSTLRDYRDPNGDSGGYFALRLVYSRSGEPCSKCRQSLQSGVVAGRSTVWCSRCQR